ncbi:hypothetical protein N802_12375 [Knoellia sinensis KCTC 19936]|uniref:Uncharacterized protein n=1 Tax=Knoellia sinensis KCTC 19936 TaxID=1385520 RepID=A0A0A0JB64_9MICO|nr:hypothetical protein [Knoellia sinensis]KGN34393.1 hypothetical protein N802_12375 [Knoellia sinensis KCTC 19936]
MTAAEASFLLGPVGALLVVPTAMATLVLARPSRRAAWGGAALAAVVAACWLAYWVNWGWVFDYADALQPVPASLEVRQTRLSVATAVGTVGLALAAGITLARTRASAR